MRRLTLVSLTALAAGLLSGCGSAPSTPLAPDKKMPDVSKMSPAQVDQLLKKNPNSGRQ